MKKDIGEILSYDIIENVGIGCVVFGLDEEEFLNEYDITKIDDKNIVDYHLSSDSYYLYNESIQLYFKLNGNNKLSYIRLSNNFQGKFMGKISIGSRFGELRALRKDMQFEMDTNSIFIGTGYKFRVSLEPNVEHTCGWDVMDFATGKIDDWLIESISMETWDKDGYYPSNSEWCSWTQKGECLDNWVEPEEKYLKIRYEY